MEVNNSVNPIRLSPFVLAVLTTSTLLSGALPAHGQADSTPTPEVEQTQSDTPDRSTEATDAATPNSEVGEPTTPVQPEQPSTPTPTPDDAAPSPTGEPEPTAPEQPAPEIPTVGEPEAPPEAEEPLETVDPDQPEQPSPPPAEDAEPSPTEAPEPAPPLEGTEADETEEPEPQVLIAEVVVAGVDEELQNLVYDAIQTQPGRVSTRSQLQEDINTIFALGYFSNVRAAPEDTPLGVRVTFFVEPNPVLQSVVIEGNQVLPQNVVDETFQEQYGTILNFRDLQNGIEQLNQWYQDNGYVLAQVIDAPRVQEDGTVTLEVAEGIVEDVQVQFLTEEGETTDEEGEPVEGRTRDFIVTREMQLEPGDVFNRTIVQEDLRRIFGLGIFEDVRLSLNPGQDPRQVIVSVEVIEARTGSLAFGAGVSSASGLFGSASFQQRNLGGNNQRLNAEVQIGERERLFELSFTDPWIAGDPFRTSYTVNAFRRRSISLIFDGGEDEVELDNGDRPRVIRTGSGVSFTRPLIKDPFADAEWTASLGFRYQRVAITDADGEVTPRDEEGNLLSFSDDGEDDLFTFQFGAVRDRRNNPLRPVQGSLLRLGVEQSVPLGSGNIALTRLRGSYSYYIPARLFRFSEECRQEEPTLEDCPQGFAFNVQAGTIIGDLPPYEAFALGGSNSVRGFDEGDVGSGRSFVQATAEYRFPIFSIVSGAVFADFGSDLGTGEDVPGDPAGVRDKPGTGFGYGIGARVQSPLGPIRIDFGINDEGDNQIHFGVGERF